MKIFWSWQSDTPAKTGRYFVRDVLQQVAKNLNAGETEDAARSDEATATSLGQQVEIDHDTRGVGGSPPIAATILQKITEAAVFVADVTPIGVTAGGKHLPNPNVMIELGYALKALDNERIVLVMNEAEGAALDNLPFDLRHWRAPVTYRLELSANDQIRKDVAKQLELELRQRIKPGLTKAKDIRERDDRITNRRPELSVRHSSGTPSPHLVYRTASLAGVATLEEIKQATPLLALAKVDPPAATFGAMNSNLYAQFGPVRPPSQWTREETQGYNRSVEAYYSAYENYLAQERDLRRLALRTIEVELVLENIGTSPATGIDVVVRFPEGIVLYENDEDFPSSPNPPKAPELLPVLPTFAYAESVDYRLDWIRPRRLTSTYVHNEDRRVEFSADELKHHHHIAFDSFFMSFESEEDIRSLEATFVITANEPIDPIEGAIPFVVKENDAD